jgi:Protein of unknown function (DUF3108)
MSLRPTPYCHYHSDVCRKLTFARKFALLAGLLASLTCSLRAQPRNESTPPPFNPGAYRVGERLTYDVSFAHFVSAAHVELFIAGRGKYFNRDGIELRGHVETTGVVNVALLALNNDYTTYVDMNTGLPYRSQQVVREAGRTSEASSDYNQPAGTDAIPDKLRTGEFPGTFDLLSALYRLRGLPLNDGSPYFINVRTESRDFAAEVRAVGREMVKTGVGSFDTIAVKVVVKDAPVSNIRVYFSDDEWHVPVLVTAKAPDGEIRAELAASELTPPAAAPTPAVTPPATPMTTDGRPPVTRSTDGATTPTGVSGTPLNLPFKVGEQLNYQVYVNNSAQPVGSVNFAVASRGRYFNRDGLVFTATAQTNGAGARVFFVNDVIKSYVDPETLLPFRTEMNLAEGKWRTTRAYNVDQERGAVVTEKSQRIEIPVGTHDLISLLYALRTFDLTPLRRNAISILAISQPRTLFVASQKRETIEVGNQKIAALLLTLTTDDSQPDRLQLRVWVGDDSRHLPLRIMAVTSLGAVRADLAIKPR